MGEMFYSIKDDEINTDPYEEDVEGTESKSKKEILNLIKEWTKYPKNSTYSDIRKFDDKIPVFYIFTGDSTDQDSDDYNEGRFVIDNKFYISNQESKYKDKILKSIKETNWDKNFIVEGNGNIHIHEVFEFLVFFVSAAEFGFKVKGIQTE